MQVERHEIYATLGRTKGTRLHHPPIVHFTHYLYLTFNYYLQKVIENIVVCGFGLSVRMSNVGLYKPIVMSNISSCQTSVHFGLEKFYFSHKRESVIASP